MKHTLFILAAVLLIVFGCSKKDNPVTGTTNGTTPKVTTDFVERGNDGVITGGGNVTSEGSSPVIARGVCWSTSENPTTSDSKTVDGDGPGSFTSTLTGLISLKRYYIRAYATNSAGTSYGPTVNYTAGDPPKVNTKSITQITSTSALSGGNITSPGSEPVTTRGVCWSINPLPTIYDYKTENGSGAGSFISTISGLSDNTFYYVRAYAINDVSIAYGNQVTFRTIHLRTPYVSTTEITGIGFNSAVGGGNVTSDGNSPVTARGVCWSTSQNPTIADSKTVDGSGIGNFTSSITGLSPGTFYYVKAYATNSVGTAYGSYETFWTTAAGSPCPGTPTVTYGGKVYNTILIGSQCWLKENLNVGTIINGGTNQAPGNGVEKYCYYNNQTYCDTYGGLYQWGEAMDYSTTPGVQGICPGGWHLPTAAEFQTLMTTVNDDGNALKNIGQGSGNGEGTNTSGFTALLAGYRSNDISFDQFYHLGDFGGFWSSTQSGANAQLLILGDNFSYVYLDSFDKNYGVSVRCIKD